MPSAADVRQNEKCVAKMETVGEIVRLSSGWITIAFGEPVESMYP
jgi:hypothetical protein